MNNPRQYIATLDGWRSIAIATVLLCHGLTLTSPTTRWERLLNPIVLNLGQQGVSLFFAISGYLITTLLLNEYRANGAVSLKGFYTRRVFRILPPAYAYLTVIAILSAFGAITLRSGELASCVLVYNNYWPGRSWFTQHFWSLSMEEHFYMLWPLLLAFLGPKRVRWAAVAGIALTILWRPFGLHAFSLNVAELQRTDMRLDAFLFACLLALLVHDNERLQRRLGTPWFFGSVVVVLAAGYGFDLRHPMQLTKLAFQSFMLPLVVVPTGFMPFSRISRLLEAAPFRWLGRISYSVYLWQQLILRGAGADSGSAMLSLALRLPVILALASASYYFIERPSMRKGRQLSSRQALIH